MESSKIAFLNLDKTFVKKFWIEIIFDNTYQEYSFILLENLKFHSDFPVKIK